MYPTTVGPCVLVIRDGTYVKGITSIQDHDTFGYGEQSFSKLRNSRQHVSSKQIKGTNYIQDIM